MDAPTPRKTAYGDHPDQFVRFDPAPGVPHGTVLLVHGGYWRRRHTLELMEPLGSHFRAAGWSTCNVEYRRGPGSPWPQPLRDVRDAAATARGLEDRGPLVAVGHSVGGQLALLAGTPVDAVVALAPVTDAGRTYRERLGDDAAQEYFGTTPDRDDKLYARASPIAQSPPAAPALIVHGWNDVRVPAIHTVDYAVTADRAGGRIDVVLTHDLDHLAAIDPARLPWPAALDWMGRFTAPPPARTTRGAEKECGA
ncbi:alpha/beta hydrolase family protein [Zhihengliuella salsuginis]|uniref:Lipase/esterase n=1 Tax=Zhihengliuella salsuginis TaxID=578222 RepID=A0ABQ3GHR8_9MICC|nr:alpha/beta fold hydrolase [Zhihengliuella salsuginis]GHD04983.1 putative lipase/esterase [Zhihengliuella salsuginis]